MKRFSLAALVFLICFETQAHMGAKRKNLPTLTYSEFTALNRNDRAAYLEELREMALRTEQAQTGRMRTASSGWIFAFLTEAMAAAGDMCIYAGYVSRRDSGNHCAAPASSAGSCGAGKTLCNPLLYGYGPGNGGICTSSRTTPTNDCENQYQKIPNYKAYQVADQVVGKNMQKAFDDQSSELNQYCATEGSAPQKGLCEKLKSKTAYMKAKLDSAEKRKNAAAPETPAATTTPTPSTPTPAPVTKPATADSAPASQPKPSTETPNSSGAIATSKEKTKPDEAPQKPEAKKNVTPGPCITNKDDYDAKKQSLPADFQKLDTEPSYYTGSKSELGMTAESGVKIELLRNGKFKLTTTMLTTVLGTKVEKLSWIPEDDVASICPATPGVISIKLLSGKTVTVRAGQGTINSHVDKYDMDYRKVSAEVFNATTRRLRGSEGLAIWKNNVDTGQVAK